MHPAMANPGQACRMGDASYPRNRWTPFDPHGLIQSLVHLCSNLDNLYVYIAKSRQLCTSKHMHFEEPYQNITCVGYGTGD
jgi:hypothetical protein